MKDPAEVLKENPGSLIFARHGEELARNGDNDKALEVLSSGINANPDYAAGYSVLAEINITQGLDEAAIEHLEKSLEIEPQSPKDLLKLGKFLIDSQPEKAKELLWKACRYEPDSSEAAAALKEAVSKSGGDVDELPSHSQAESNRMSGLDLLKPIEVTDDTKSSLGADEIGIDQEPEAADSFEEMLSDFADSDDIDIPESSADTTDETAGLEESVPEELSDEADSSIPSDADIELSLTEEPAASDIDEDALEGSLDESEEIEMPAGFEDTLTEEETEEGLSDASNEFEIDLMPETENALAEMYGNIETPEEAEAPEEALEMDNVTFDSSETDVEEPLDDIDLSMPADMDEDMPEQSMDDTDFSMPDEIEGHQMPEDASEPETEEPVDEETGSDDDDIMAELAMLSDDTEEEEEEEDNEVAEVMEEIPGYSEMIDKETPKILQTPDIILSKKGVLEIDDDNGDYNISEFEKDISEENADEPVLTDEERAELLELEKSPEDDKKKTELEETVNIQQDETDFSGISDTDAPDTIQNDTDDILPENLYGDLSKDELEVLSDTDVEPDDEEKHLEIETNEGIDYSDILYGKEPAIESDDHSTSIPSDINDTPLEEIEDLGITAEQEIEDLTAEELDIEDLPEESSYADIIEPDDLIMTDTEEETEEIEDSAEFTEDATPEITGEFDIEETQDEDLNDIPDSPQQDSGEWAEEGLTAEQEIENLAAKEFDIEDLQEESSYADIIESDDLDLTDTEEETEEIEDTAEFTEDAMPEISGEFDIEETQEEDLNDIPDSPQQDSGEWAEEGLTAEQEIENLTAKEIDIEDISEGSSYADIIKSDDLDMTDTEEENEDIEDSAEFSESEIPETAGEYDIEDITDEESTEESEFPIKEDIEDMAAAREIKELSIQEIDEEVFDEESLSEGDMSNGSHYLGLPVDENEIDDVEKSSLGDLIYDYVAAMKNTAVVSVSEESVNSDETGQEDSSINGNEVEIDLNGDISYDLEVEDETPSVGEATVTMAEIFVSQGLTSRAIEIYKVLLEQKPENEEIKARLKELQDNFENQSGDE